MSDVPPPEEARPTYRIGAVSRLTGLSTHTLRKWEDRHGLVAPRRSEGGERLYSRDDVQRLCLARDLARAGTPLANLAPLSNGEMERLLAETRQVRDGDSERGELTPLGIAVLGSALPTLVQQDASLLRHARLLAGSGDVNALTEALGDVPPDVLVVECPALSPDTPGELARIMETTNAAAAVVVYSFGSHADVDALRSASLAPVRAPLDVGELERHCLGLVAALRGPAAAAASSRPVECRRRFTRDELAHIAGMSTDIACECPRHLADLIMSLDAFEAYSASCENRDAKDAALHRHLHETATAGRALLEAALARVVEHEDLDLTDHRR